MGRAQRQPSRKQEKARERRQKQRVEEAAKFCSDVLTDGWPEAVADRATKYVTETTWRQLVERHRRRRCRILAQLASSILASKKKMHDLVGALGVWIMSLIGGDQIVQTFARELASKIPLPYDAKLVATARGIQVTGVLLCLINGDELTRCQCFIDLALTETKTRVKKILVAALEDWTGLAGFPPKEGAASPRT